MTPDLPTLRRQLQQLQDLHASGALDEAQFAQSRERLERLIVEQVMNQAGDAVVEGAPAPAAPVKPPAPARAAAAPSVRPSSRMFALCTAVVLVVAVGGYAIKGRPDLWNQRAGTPEAAAAAGGGQGGSHEVTMEQIAAMADGLRDRLAKEPQNAEGWAMLGRSYSVLNRHADAVPAYRKAIELVPDDAGLLADLADALAVVNNRQIAGEPMQFIERALKIDPNQPKALSLAGTDAFLRGDFKAASTLWERILASQPPGSPMAQQVRESINEARQRGGLPLLAEGEVPKVAATAATGAVKPVQADQKAAQPAAAGKATVAGTVTLAPALAAKASPDDTVFVFARAAEGLRMPLAILRKQVRDLPITFTLDDSSAMAPAMRLSNFPQVIVGARVSKSGNAMPQPGDLQGLSQPVALGSSGLKIVIGEEVGR
ncbi:tetratricopeptide repeat protein [Leptothrix sp. BB-4]